MATCPNFQRCLPIILEVEGGLSNHPADPGGLTNHGITQATYSRYLQQLGQPSYPVTGITKSEIEDLYFRLYWLEAGCHNLPLPLGLCVFDGAVHSGPKRAVKLLQECIGVPPDGDFGPLTLLAVREEKLSPLCRRYLATRLRLLRRLAVGPKKVFKKGWTNRIRKIKLYVETFLEET